MDSTIQRVLKDSTETIWTYPPILAVASGTPTARIGTQAEGLPTSGSNATVDSVSTTLSADADAGDTRLTVASATWVKGRKYLITATTGEIVPVESLTSGTGTTLDIAEPLPVACASGSTVKGYRISIALTATQTASIGRSVVEWTASLDGVSKTWADYFEVVEFDAGYTLDAATLLASSPYCALKRPDSDADFREMIDAAYRRHIEVALMAKGLSPARLVSRRLLESVHIAACELFLAQQFEDDQTIRDEKRRDFADQLSLVLNSRDLWVSEDQTLNPPDEGPRLFNTTMVLR